MGDGVCADALYGLCDGEDRDALMLSEIEQIAVARDDAGDVSGDGAGDDVIVVGIAKKGS